MIFEIDQSGKIEDTNKLTIVAYADVNRLMSIKISAVEKRKLLNVMRVLDFPKRNYIYKIFAALIFILSVDIKPTDSLVIDREYPGHEQSIKGMIITLYRKDKKKAPEIKFGLIGKSSRAHKAAIDTYRGNRPPDLIVKSEDILGLLY